MRYLLLIFLVAIVFIGTLSFVNYLSDGITIPSDLSVLLVTKNTKQEVVSNRKILLPPSKGVYLGAFPYFGNNEDEVTKKHIIDFENLIDKKITWAYFSNNWHEKIEFPKEEVITIYKQSIIPFIRLMPRSTFELGKSDDVFTLQKIIDGQFDEELKIWANEAKSTNIPLLLDFGVEMNGDWFSWSGFFNGSEETEEYGDMVLADGPERYQDAYRHIVKLFKEQEVLNVTWFWHVNNGSFPAESWNKIANYYPGDDYVDWLGVSVYGALDNSEEWFSFEEQMDNVYQELVEISNKPIALLEFGVDGNSLKGSQADWISDALTVIKTGKYPRLKAVSYWHESWINADGSVSNLRLDSSPQTLNTYKNLINNNFFIVLPKFSIN